MTLSRRILSILALTLFSIGLYAQETGKADIFSDEFQGSWTASKTTYNKSEFVAAHKSYEFGTILKVMIAGQDKAINVRVVDRGPFKFGYVVTLSRAAATELGLKDDDTRDVVIMVAREQGLATVAPSTNTSAPTQPTTTIINPNQTSTVITNTPAEQPKVTYTAPTTTVIRPTREFVTKGNIEAGTTTTNTVVAAPTQPVVTTTRSTVVPSSTVGFGLQVGSFVDYNNAMIEMSNLQNKSINNLLLNAVNDKSGKTVYKLIIGPFSNRTDVEQYKTIQPNRYNNQAFIVDLSTMR